MMVTVPPSFSSGMKLRVNLPANGGELDVVIPAGLTEGMTFEVAGAQGTVVGKALPAADVPIDEAALPPNVEWALFGDDLALVLKQACTLGLLPDPAGGLKTVAANLRDGRFTTDHYLRLYGERVWKATHKEEVAAMAAAQEVQQRAQEEAEQQQMLAPTMGVQRVVQAKSQSIGLLWMGSFWLGLYAALLAQIALIGLALLSTIDPNIAVIYIVFFWFAFIWTRFLCQNLCMLHVISKPSP